MVFTVGVVGVRELISPVRIEVPMMSCRIPTLLLAVVVGVGQHVAAAELTLRDQELGTRLEVGYAVRLVDMNADRRLDIAIVDSKRFLWLENPNWQEHIIFAEPSAKFDNVCFAPLDIDGDGRLDFAVGRDWQPNNTNSGGTIGWIRQSASQDQPWTYHPIAEEPTTHRMHFVDVQGDGRAELVVSPLKGRNTTAPDFMEAGVRQLAFQIPADPAQDPWPVTVLNEDLHVTHGFSPLAWDADPAPEMLFVSFEGVHLLDRTHDDRWKRVKLGAGEQSTPPNRGASEIKIGQLRSGSRYLATVEPWHGDRVVIYQEPTTKSLSSDGLWLRQVLDKDLKWGHCVWCANLDNDPDEELIVGVRDDLDTKDPAKRRGLRVYDAADERGTKWMRKIFDPGSVAIEDLAAGDLNGDGRIDIVAVGRQTHNVKIYWNETRAD